MKRFMAALIIVIGRPSVALSGPGLMDDGIGAMQRAQNRAFRPYLCH